MRAATAVLGAVSRSFRQRRAISARTVRHWGVPQFHQLSHRCCDGRSRCLASDGRWSPCIMVIPFGALRLKNPWRRHGQPPWVLSVT